MASSSAFASAASGSYPYPCPFQTFPFVGRRTPGRLDLTSRTDAAVVQVGSDCSCLAIALVEWRGLTCEWAVVKYSLAAHELSARIVTHKKRNLEEERSWLGAYGRS